METQRSKAVIAFFAAMLAGTLISSGRASDRVITIISYNVENLFDTEDDPQNEGDDTYIPLANKGTPEHKASCERNTPANSHFREECLDLDWSEATLEAKVRNLTAVIDAFEGDKGPDVLILQEVENEAVLKTLRDGLIHGSEYVTLVNLDTSPGRGIDVALLSKLPIASGRSPKAHRVDFAPADQAVCETTRDILEVPLALPDGAVLTVFGVHFPSNEKPTQCRNAAATELNRLVSALPVDAPAIAGGDTNINCEQAQQSTISQVLQKQWIVPDEIWKGCRPPGTSFLIKREDDGSFRPQWSFLDLLMATPDLTVSARNGPNWFVDFGSFRTVIASPEHQVKVDGLGRASPLRFDATSARGNSDHWPVAINLIRKS